MVQKNIFKRGSALPALLVFSWLLTACGGTAEPTKDPAADYPADARYYSLMGFVRDQYRLQAGQPVTLTRVITREGGQRDSAYVPMHKMKWSEIFKFVNEADISPRRFLGRYRFSDFVDSTTFQRNLVYDAAEPDLPTRRMLVSVNPFNDRITSVFVQFSKNGLERRLYYEPQLYLRIDEEGGGAARNLRTEYYWQ